MLFHFADDRACLRRALLAAVATRRHDTLRELAALRTDRQLAGALSGCSARVVDDVLSLLPPARRDAIRGCLQGSVLRRLARRWLPVPHLEQA